jgi:hypothetical protein
MDKETFIKTYIDIETQTFVRSDKTKRLNDFIANLKTNNFNLSLGDTIDSINYLQREKITIRQPLFLNVFYPTLTTEIDKNDIDAIKSLIRLFEYYGNYQNLTSDNRFSVWQLLEQGLRLSPNDTELLKQYEEKQRDYFEYTLHELPTGVLYGSDGATIEQCEELLNDLAKYKVVCDKLKVDNEELITECKFYYSSYKDYLTIYKNYGGFGDYLDKNQIEK